MRDGLTLLPFIEKSVAAVLATLTKQCRKLILSGARRKLPLYLRFCNLIFGLCISVLNEVNHQNTLLISQY